MRPRERLRCIVRPCQGGTVCFPKIQKKKISRSHRLCCLQTTVPVGDEFGILLLRFLHIIISTPSYQLHALNTYALILPLEHAR